MSLFRKRICNSIKSPLHQPAELFNGLLHRAEHPINIYSSYNHLFKSHPAPSRYDTDYSSSSLQASLPSSNVQHFIQVPYVQRSCCAIHRQHRRHSDEEFKEKQLHIPRVGSQGSTNGSIRAFLFGDGENKTNHFKSFSLLLALK